MDPKYAHLKKSFPCLSQKEIRKKYKTRITRLWVLSLFHIPTDVKMYIEGLVRPSDVNNFGLPGMGTSLYARKRRARYMESKCHKCSRQTCSGKCPSPGYVSANREDKIDFCKNGLKNENLNDIRASLKSHPSGYVWGAMYKLWPQFHSEKERLGNLTIKDPTVQFAKMLNGTQNQDPSTSEHGL